MLGWIKQHAEYQRFLQPDFTVRTAHFFVPVLQGEERFDIGITISKKIGNAVLRNKLRRRIKSWARQQDRLPVSKINVVARAGAGILSWAELCAELDQIICLLRQKLA